MNEILDRTIRVYAREMANQVPKLSNDKAQQYLYDKCFELVNKLVAKDGMLHFLMQRSNVQRGVSMHYEETIKWWQDLNIRTGDDLATALDNFKIIFACNTNSIEGSSVNYHTTREVFESEQLSNFSGTVRDIFETQNQKFAFDYFIKAFNDELDIDMHMILKLHGIMMYGCYDEVRWRKGERPGKFKRGDYCVGVTDVGSFPDEVEEHLQDLIDEMNENELTGDVLIKAAYLHVVFETIHPFADGNGRVGRTLMNYYLVRHNYPPIVIYNEDKETYYLALEVYNRTGKIDGFVKFLQEQLVKTWESKITSRKSSEVQKLSAFLDV